MPLFTNGSKMCRVHWPTNSLYSTKWLEYETFFIPDEHASWFRIVNTTQWIVAAQIRATHSECVNIHWPLLLLSYSARCGIGPDEDIVTYLNCSKNSSSLCRIYFAKKATTLQYDIINNNKPALIKCKIDDRLFLFMCFDIMHSCAGLLLVAMP